MKRKRRIVLYICIAVGACLLTLFMRFILLEPAKALTDGYRFKGRIYWAVTGYYVVGKAVGRSGNTVLYSVEGDSESIYLIDSSKHSLYLREDAQAPHMRPTGVFWNTDYSDDAALVDLAAELLLWNDGAGGDACLDRQAIVSAVDISEFCRISLCYDNYKASQEFAGCISKNGAGYIFIPEQEIRRTAYTGQTRYFCGVRIREEYYPVLDSYYK